MNLWIEPLSCTAPETPWATLILSVSLDGSTNQQVCEVEKPQKLYLLPQSTISYLKYRFWLPRFLSMASSEPMPRYFFSLMPSEKKYSPGASVVAARREPIITDTRQHQEQGVSSRKAVTTKPLGPLAQDPDRPLMP